MDCTKILMVIPVTVVLMISASGCTSMPPPDAYHSEQSYVMYKHDIDPQRAIYSSIDLQVADRCVATFSRGNEEKTKIEASWTGECKNGRADGLGVMRFREFEDRGEDHKGDEQFRLSVVAGVVEGVVVAGKCVRGVATTAKEHPDVKLLPTIRFVGVRPCEDEDGSPSAFTWAMGNIKLERDVRADSFSTLNPLALDFFRTTFPRHHIKGITYNPDDTRSSFKQILIGALRVFTMVGQLKVAEKRAKNAANAYDQHRSQGSKALNTYVDVFPMDKDEVLDLSNKKYDFFVTCGKKADVPLITYVWVKDDEPYYCGSRSDEAVSRCQAWVSGAIDWKLNPDQINYVDGWRQKSGVLNIRLNLDDDQDITEAKDGTYSLLSLYTETIPRTNIPDTVVQHTKELSGDCTVHHNRNR